MQGRNLVNVKILCLPTDAPERTGPRLYFLGQPPAGFFLRSACFTAFFQDPLILMRSGGNRLPPWPNFLGKFTSNSYLNES